MRLPRKNEVYVGAFLLWAFLVSTAIGVLLYSQTPSNAEALLADERGQMKAIAQQLGIMQARQDRTEALLETMLPSSTVPGGEDSDASTSEADEQLNTLLNAHIAVRLGFLDIGTTKVKDLVKSIKTAKVPFKTEPNTVKFENNGRGMFKMVSDLRGTCEWYWTLTDNQTALLSKVCIDDDGQKRCVTDWKEKIYVLRVSM